jgi:uncharacterized protein YndB with AHSA1/START domain
VDPEKWKRIDQRMFVRAPLESAYAAWATAKGLVGWFPLEAALTDADGRALPPGQAASEGDRFRLTWHTGHEEAGEFLEANGRDLLRYTFGRDIEVTVRFEQTEDGSVLVQLTQTQDRSDEENLQILMGFKEGWAFYLTNLKSVLEGGLDLRDFREDVEHRVNY